MSEPSTLASNSETEKASVDRVRPSGLPKQLWLGLGAVSVLTVGSLVAAGFLIKPGYVALIPGSVRPTEDLVVVQGADSFESEGEVYYTTVRLKQDLSWWEYKILGFDDDANIVVEEQILGDRTSEQMLEENRLLMTDSKDVAVAVALNRLGYSTITSDGVQIVQIVEGASADGTLELGDVIIGLDGEPMGAAIDLVNAIGDREPGVEVVLTVERGGDVVDVLVTLGGRDEDPDSPFLGVAPIDRIHLADQMPIDVDIDSGSVGGPSAGLAFTLAILDSLTPGDLAGGHDVAVTGTISPTGAVGQIGGILQKAAGVADSGADVFLVPLAQGEDEIAGVRERLGDDVEVIPVASLDEALEALGRLGGNVESVDNFDAS